jgi:hypothetical protein
MTGRTSDNFGQAVAASGDRIVIGAPSADVFHGESRFSEQGVAYVVVRNGNEWIQESKLVADEGIPEEFFGRSVAISGNTIAVGAEADDIGQNTDQGSAYIFTGGGSNWTQRAKLTAADGAAGDGFGNSVALSGGTLLVGAAKDDVAGHADQGSVYVFNGSGAAWSQQAKLVAGDGAADDEFGSAIALDGDTAIISNETDDLAANKNQGSAYVCVRAGTVWSKQAKLKADDRRQT